MQTTVGDIRESVKHVSTLVILINATLFLAGCGAAPDYSVTSEDIRAITEEAYIFSFPILEQYKMLFAQSLYEDSGAYSAPLNVLHHNAELLGPDYTLIVRPNNDTLYSGVWLDLRAEPTVLSVPPIPLERYYSFQLIDLYTHNFDYLKAFWSLTMYDGQTQLFIENPLDRYLLNSTMIDQFKRERDGSLVLRIQKESPGPDRESNWLPAPVGPFYMVLRLYGPEAAALGGEWTPPPAEPVAAK